MGVRSVHDRDELAALLRRDPALYAYQLGDLDDFFWPYTSWYALGDAVALLYHGGPLPTLLAFGPTGATGDPGAAGPDGPQNALLGDLRRLLPPRFHAHLSPGLDTALAPDFHATPAVPHHKLALTAAERLDGVAAAGTVLTDADLPALTRLYAVAYPGNWFDRRMLATGQYIGVRRDGDLVAVAGVHVWSPTYRVAALGNVTTHPAHRGRGLATAAVAGLCRRLLTTVDHISLNVHAGNASAIGVYTRLGFTPVARYGEHTVTVARAR